MEHVQDRAIQRYGKELTSKEIADLGKLIYLGKCIHCGKASNDCYFAYVKYKNLPVKCLYTKRNNKIRVITLYPIDVEEYNFLISSEAIESAKTLLQDNGYIVIKIGETK